ncbi:PREDICTED: uncharacterized protein LOC105566118 [Vollenhovia emeryi]|uniref:uncharacterized protein LOC105566118 n=1 Tax=Vollenhovia emeryi TaxID=411798 RepID=UPI0005F3740C|nr:PREDICTED: uncharacterized protein LOC105566118 [Vollenhovia emeryi]
MASSCIFLVISTRRILQRRRERDWNKDNALRDPIATALVPGSNPVTSRNQEETSARRGTKEPSSQRILRTRLCHTKKNIGYLTVLASHTVSLSQPSGDSSLRLIRSDNGGTRKGMDANAESVKVVRRSDYRKSFSAPSRFDDFWPS